MYGAIYGDLAGSIYEYAQTKEIKRVSPGELIVDSSFYSDDTILTIAILDAILNDKDYDKYLREYIKRYKSYRPKFSPYFKTAFSPSLLKWSESDNIGNSRGNGALMRISPVGFMFDSELEVIEHARLATIPSHNSEEAINAATTIALMIYYFRKGFSKEEVYKRLKLNTDYFYFTKFNTTCDETLDNCLYAFYKSNDFESSIRNTLLMGGDTDTNCAIVGSLAEALYGMDDELIKQVEEKIPSDFTRVLRKATL